MDPYEELDALLFYRAYIPTALGCLFLLFLTFHHAFDEVHVDIQRLEDLPLALGDVRERQAPACLAHGADLLELDEELRHGVLF